MLVLWLDCDREGENIGFEVVQICQKANQRLSIEAGTIIRARFSDYTPTSIFRAMQNPTLPNIHDSLAVDARQEIDLRIGAAFTRFQTMRLRRQFANMPKNISYGPCQFPTLGFIVERWFKIQNFVQEKFWQITCEYRDAASGGFANFSWSRGRLYDRHACLVLYELCVDNPTAQVVNIRKRETRRYKPLPLNTVEMQKLGSRILRMGAQQTMSVAESLYNKGFISYPRTETDLYTMMDNELCDLVQQLEPSQEYGDYARRLLHEGQYNRPRTGKNNDNAHPPIHPVKYPDQPLNNDEKRLYDLVCRHFLASCSKDGIGHETVVTVDLAGETFTSSGLMITERNYLDIYTFDVWTNRNIPVFQENQQFVPTGLFMREGTTSPPPLLSEADLISTMDKNGIGTDATIAQHIAKIQERGYAEKVGSNFKPTELGLALVQGYDAMGFELSKPNMRAKMEADMNAISRNARSKDSVLEENLKMYKSVFLKVRKKAKILDSHVAKYFATIGHSSKTTKRSISRCGKCGNMMDLCKEGDTRFVKCDECGDVHNIPKHGNPSGFDHTCPICNYQVLQIDKENSSYHICPHCFNNSPPDIENAADNNFYCFQCIRRDCALAKGRSSNGEIVRKCPSCGEDLELRTSKAGKPYIMCKGSKSKKCENRIFFNNIAEASVSTEKCASCMSTKLHITPVAGAYPGDGADVVCIFCEQNAFPDAFVLRGNFATNVSVGHSRNQHQQRMPQHPPPFQPRPFNHRSLPNQRQQQQQQQPLQRVWYPQPSGRGAPYQSPPAQQGQLYPHRQLQQTRSPPYPYQHHNANNNNNNIRR